MMGKTYIHDSDFEEVFDTPHYFFFEKNEEKRKKIDKFKEASLQTSLSNDINADRRMVMAKSELLRTELIEFKREEEVQRQK